MSDGRSRIGSGAVDEPFYRLAIDVQEETLSGPVTDQRAHDLRRLYHERFRAPQFSVPVESIAEDLLRLAVEESAEIECSGMLPPAERRVIVRADESPEREVAARFLGVSAEAMAWRLYNLGLRRDRS